MAGGSGQVGADGAESLGAVHGAHAAGDLDAQFAHADDLLGFIVIGRNPQVMGEPEIVTGAGAHPGGQGVPLSLQLAAAGGVQDDPGVRGVAEPAAVFFQDFRVDGIVPGSAGGVGGLFQLQQRAGGLPRPDHVVRGAGLGHRGQLPEQVSTAQGVPGHAVIAVVGRPGIMAGDPGEGRQHPGRVHALPASLAAYALSLLLSRTFNADDRDMLRLLLPARFKARAPG